MSNHHVIFHSDNSAVVTAVNKQTSRNSEMMVLVRQFVLNCLFFNLKFSALHIRGIYNSLSDDISRLQVTEMNAQSRGLKRSPDIVPTHLLPENWTVI